MTEYYLHTEAYYQFMTGTGDPGAADVAPLGPKANEEDTAPLAETGQTPQSAGPPLAANNENDAPSMIQHLRRALLPGQRAAASGQREYDPPNNEPYYQVDVQEDEEPDWGRDSESEGCAQPRESLDTKPEAAANGPTVPLGHQRPAEPEGPPPDTATAKRRPTEAWKKQRNQEDRAKWRARRAEKRRRGQAPG